VADVGPPNANTSPRIRGRTPFAGQPPIALIEPCTGVAGVESFTTDEIMELLGRENTPEIDKNQVSACIRSAGARFDRVSRTWSVDRSDDDLAFEQVG
jgi:hypothetical protein